jgi:3-oxoadipate enol-lactonase
VQIVDRGSGPPLVFIPGLQGRWEYMRRTVDALAESCRVITFSLCDEPAAEFPFDPARGLDNYVGQVDAALNDLGIRKAAISGLSFGGIIALHVAASHADRATALILVSTPGPGWRLRPIHAVYAEWPWLFAPLFFAGMPRRLRAELTAALPDRHERWAFKWEQVRTFFRAPLHPSRMAARAKLIASSDPAADCARIAVPTLVVTGEPELDHVVAGSSEYARQIAGARLVQLPCTGHLGSLTHSHAFANLVTQFLAAHEAHDAA